MALTLSVSVIAVSVVAIGVMAVKARQAAPASHSEGAPIPAVEKRADPPTIPNETAEHKAHADFMNNFKSPAEPKAQQPGTLAGPQK